MVRIGLIAASDEAQTRLLEGKLPANVTIVSEGRLDTLGEASSEETLLAAQPDIVLVESNSVDALPAAIERIKSALPRAWILPVGVKPEAEHLIRAVQAGARDFLAKPVNFATLSEVLSRFYKENPSARMSPGKFLAVTSPKGGCGATCVSINLAAALAQFDETKVALVDLGTPLGDIAAYLGFKPVYGLHDALEAGDRLDSVLLGTFMLSKAGFRVLTGSTEFKETLDALRSSTQRLTQVLSLDFTHTVVDLSLHLPSDMVTDILSRADEILVVITAEIPSVWSVLRFLYFVDELGKADQTRIIINRDQTSSQIRTKDIEKLLGHKIFHAIPNNYRAMIEAVNSGRAVLESDRSNLTQSFMSLAEALTGLKPASKKRKTIFGLFS